jgi:hypothetical protein
MSVSLLFAGRRSLDPSCVCAALVRVVGSEGDEVLEVLQVLYVEYFVVHALSL